MKINLKTVLIAVGALFFLKQVVFVNSPATPVTPVVSPPEPVVVGLNAEQAAALQAEAARLRTEVERLQAQLEAKSANIQKQSSYPLQEYYMELARVPNDQYLGALSEILKERGQMVESANRAGVPVPFGKNVAKDIELLVRVQRKGDMVNVVRTPGVRDQVIMKGMEQMPERLKDLGLQLVKNPYLSLEKVNEKPCPAFECRPLITGTARGGLDWMVGSLSSHGITAPYSTLGAKAVVSWTYGVVTSDGSYPGESADDRRLRLSGDFAFHPVIHLVRHPISTISDIVECICEPQLWSQESENLWSFVEQVAMGFEVGGREGRDAAIYKALLYYTTWHSQIHAEAQWRARVETAELSEIMTVLKLPMNAAAQPYQRPLPLSAPVTWSDLRRVDPKLENLVWSLTQSFGYDRNP